MNVKMRKLNLTIKDKISLLTGIIILFCFLIGIITVNSLKRINHYHQLQTTNKELISNSFRLKSLSNEILANYNRPDFFNKKDNFIEEQIDTILLENNKNIAYLKNIKTIQQEEIAAGLQEIADLQEEYSTMVLDFSKKIAIKGNKKTGAIEDMLESSNTLKNFISLLNNNYALNLVANIKSLESIYFSTEEPEHLQAITRRIDEAIEFIGMGMAESLQEFDDVQISELTGYLNDYKVAVSNLISAEENTGQTGDQTRLATRLENSSGQLEKKLNQINVKLNAIIDDNISKSVNNLIILLVIASIIIIAYLFYLLYNFESSIKSVTEYIRKLIKGYLPEKIELRGNDEISTINQLLMNFVEDLRKKAEFAKNIGKGNLSASYKPLGDEDLLGNSLIEMEKSLQLAKEEEEKYQAEDRKRRWSNEGLAKFGEILRQNNDNITLLCDNIIQNMINYLDANQGGIFIVNENDDAEKVLDLVSAFAYNKKKYTEKRILPGEGLIGTCMIEKDTLMLTEIPEDYITITSGLGEATPNCILILPLKLEDEVLGVIEMASFNKFQPHEIEFAEKIASSIASTINAVKINEQTAKLLEQSQKQAQEMTEQEEEMRQNMEELQATQEESARRENEISGILNAIDTASLFIEFDMKGKIIKVNSKLLELLDTTENTLIGKDYAYFAGIESSDASYRKMWEDLAAGKSIIKTDKIRLASGTNIWLKEHFSPIFDTSGIPYKILTMASDITETKQSEESMKNQAIELARKNIELNSIMEAVDNSLIKCELDQEGVITVVNDNFVHATGLKPADLPGIKYITLLADDEREEFENIWKKLHEGKSFKGVVKRTRKDGREIWLMSNFNPVIDEAGNLYKVYYLAQDITEKKQRYKMLEEANLEIENLKKKLSDKKGK